MYKKYVVRLTKEERGQLETLVRRGRAHTLKLLYARILLKADADESTRPLDRREDRGGYGGYYRHGGAGEAALL